jgi:hypothetical protein
MQAFAMAMAVMDVTEEDMLGHAFALTTLLMYHLAPAMSHNLSYPGPLKVSLLDKSITVRPANG